MECRPRLEIMRELIYRFFVGGFIVSIFALIGDVLRPKSFAGLFGAAPSVALATLSLTIMTSGRGFAATEARSMIAGAVGFLVYAALCVRLMKKHNVPVTKVTIGGLVVWVAVAMGIWLLLLR